jgi:hypothetical protein
MPVPNTFANATTSIPLSQLDNNFATPITIGNTAVQLGNTVTTLNNMTLANVTISSVANVINNVSLSNVTISSGNVAANVANSTIDGSNTAGYLVIPQNSQNGNYNVLLADTGRHLYHPPGQAAATYTIPAGSNVAFSTGAAITFVNMSANAVTIAITTDTMYLSSAGTTGSRTLAQYGIATVVKMTSSTWIISGSGLT